MTPTLLSKHQSITIKRRSRFSLGITSILFLILASACLSRFDQVTYQRLTDLKPVAIRSMQSFGRDDVDYEATESVILQLDQMFEYEKGKGEYNSAMTLQVDKIKTIYVRGLENRRQKNQPWNTKVLQNKIVLLQKAFDTAIQTEAAKNR